MKKLLFIIVLGFSLNLFSQGTAPKGDAPVLSNFRIENGQESRVYFDSSKGITGSKKKGFTISGKTISILSINSDQTAGHYFTVSKAFTFWDNNTIRYEGGSDLKDAQNNELNNFTLEYIINDISEPEATKNTYYVSLTGDDKNKGTSESAAWRTISKAANTAKSGSTVWIKAGDYGNENIVIKNSGKIDQPIKFKGYTNKIGDLDNDYIVDSFAYTSASGAAAKIEASKWPVIDGTNGDKSKGISISSKSNIIIKNIQLKENYYNAFVNSSYNLVFENVTTALGLYDGDVGHGIFVGVADSNNVRAYKCLSFDNGSSNIRMFGQYNAMINCHTYTGKSVEENTDYQINLYNSDYSIVYGCQTKALWALGSIGHGIGIKNSNVSQEASYNLFENNVIYQDQGEALFFAHQGTHDNVAKNNRIYGDEALGYKLTGLRARSGAYNNIFENNYVEYYLNGINIGNNSENEPIASGSIGSNNTFRNNILNNGYRAITITSRNATNLYEVINNKIYNNTFHNIVSALFFVHFNDAGSVTTFSGNEVKNNIFSTGNANLYKDQATSSNFLKQYNNYYKLSNINTQNETGDISVNPFFFDLIDFVPTNKDLKSGIPILNNKYDKNNKYRSPTTPTMGAIEIQDSFTGSVRADAGEDQTICQGESVILTASGGTSYEWSTGETTASIEVSPTVTETYTVTAKDGNMTDEDEVIVTVNTVTADAGEDKTIEQGENVKLTASGGDSYLWNTGETSKSIIVGPSESTTYSVSVIKGECEDVDSVQVTVKEINISNPPLTVASAGDDVSICLGESITLNASGGDSYIWSTGDLQKDIQVNPSRTTIYTLTANNGGVTTMDSVIVSVENCNISSTNEEVLQSEFEVYPNPSKGDLNLKVSGYDGEEFNLVLISTNGTIVYKDKMNSNQGSISKQIDISKLVRGIYFVRIFNSDQNMIKKILII